MSPKFAKNALEKTFGLANGNMNVIVAHIAVSYNLHKDCHQLHKQQIIYNTQTLYNLYRFSYRHK